MAAVIDPVISLRITRDVESRPSARTMKRVALAPSILITAIFALITTVLSATARTASENAPCRPPTKVDIAFILDRSGSMGPVELGESYNIQVEGVARALRDPDVIPRDVLGRSWVRPAMLRSGATLSALPCLHLRRSTTLRSCCVASPAYHGAVHHLHPRKPCIRQPSVLPISMTASFINTCSSFLPSRRSSFLLLPVAAAAALIGDSASTTILPSGSPVYHSPRLSDGSPEQQILRLPPPCLLQRCSIALRAPVPPRRRYKQETYRKTGPLALLNVEQGSILLFHIVKDPLTIIPKREDVVEPALDFYSRCPGHIRARSITTIAGAQYHNIAGLTPMFCPHFLVENDRAITVFS